MEELLRAAIPALSGLLGVLLGGWIAVRGQERQRRHERIRAQLDTFYGPLLAMRAYIAALIKLDRMIQDRTTAVWQEALGDLAPEAKERVAARLRPEVVASIDYSNRQLRKTILPRYHEMVDHFETHLSLAEPATRSHYESLVQFVALWDRWNEKGVPPNVVAQLQNESVVHERNLAPLYEDLEQQVAKLSAKLGK